MKKLYLVLALAAIFLSSCTREYPIGASIAFCGKNVTQEQLDELKAAGVEWVEVVMNGFSRNCPENEGYIRAFRQKEMIRKAGLKVWSCHLPFSRTLDISVLDPEVREENVRFQERMIELAAIFGPKMLVLHPSSEPIADEERQERLLCSKNSIGRLSVAAKRIGAVLCIEDLPRTCLGRESSEIRYLIEDYPEVMVCFDSNHLLTETHDAFFEGVGDRVATIHASDYDRINERHWIEGTGCVDWPAFRANLFKYGYKGVFMHEVSHKDDLSAADLVEAYNTVVCGKKK